MVNVIVAITSLNRVFTGDRTFSLRTEFPDTWYELNNPDTMDDPTQQLVAALTVTPDDLPPNIADLTLTQLTVFALRDEAFTDEITIAALRHITKGHTTEAGPVTTTGGIIGTRRPGGAPWQIHIGADPTGRWELHLSKTAHLSDPGSPTTRSKTWSRVMTLNGTTPAWP